MRYRLALLVVLLFVLVAFLFAQERGKTRSAAPPAIPASSPIFPLPGFDAQGMTWSEILAMISVLASISGGFQWIITRAIVQPQIEKSIKAATKEIMGACIEQFTTKYAFGLHEKSDEANHESVMQQIQDLAEHRDTENERVTDARERIRVLEARTPRR